MENKGIITAQEMELCRHCIKYAMDAGASALRVSLSKSIQNSIAVLDGEVDKISFNQDRSIFLHLYAGGHFGTFSTNRLGQKELEEFISSAIETVSVLAEDPCQRLPEPGMKATDCSKGDELGLLDEGYFNIGQEEKVAIAVKAGRSEWNKYRLESVESEYSDSIDDNYLVDSDGFEGRHTESNFGYCSEVTIMDGEGCRYSGYQWMSTPFWKDFDPGDVTAQAIEMAAAQVDPQEVESGKYKVVVQAKAASRLVGPIIHALDGNSVQQKFSFLCDALGKQVFSPKLNIYDKATERGRMGSRLFDTEGVAVTDGPIIEDGVVKKFFVNTYCHAKTGMEATVEGPSRPTVLPFICNSDKKEINLDDILAHCGSGILISGFNGGNCNHASGNFSFGIEGFVFENGKIAYPIDEALMTGNMMELWNNLLAAGSDARSCARWQIPSLAFGNVDISA